MDAQRLGKWQHDHVFAQDKKRAGEKRTLFVVAMTAVMMVVEIAAGLAFGSMLAMRRSRYSDLSESGAGVERA